MSYLWHGGTKTDCLLTRQGNDAESSDYMFKTEMERV